MPIELRFAIPGKPVSKNAYNRFDKRGNPHGFITNEGREFQARIRLWARRAAFASAWPSDPFCVDHVRISIYKFNTKGDHGAGNELLFDALEFRKFRIKIYKEDEPFGLYANDRCVSLGECPKPDFDSGEPRIEIKIELLAMCGASEARDRRSEWFAAEERRRIRRNAKARDARIAKKEKLTAS